MYFPDINDKKKPIDREYFFNILNSIYPEYVNQLIEHAQQLRNAPQLDEEKKQYIMISDEWYEKLMSHPFISRKPGKTIQLLKESTKIFKGRRQKQTKEIGITLKRFKGMESGQITIPQNINEKIDLLHNELSYEYDHSDIQTPKTQRLFNI